MSDNEAKPAAGRSAGKIMMIVAWLVGMLLAVKFFAVWEDNQVNPNKDPQSSYKAGYNEVTLKSGRGGHYVASGYINGQTVVFMLDTGATQVAIPASLADKLNLKKGMPIELNTANGIARGWATTLQQVKLGAIELTNVPATINPNMDGEVLLGMSFLSALEMIRQRDGDLTLRQYKSNR